jgi:hypothetical protein
VVLTVEALFTTHTLGSTSAGVDETLSQISHNPRHVSVQLLWFACCMLSIRQEGVRCLANSHLLLSFHNAAHEGGARCRRP